MAGELALAHAEIQAQLLSDAVLTASVGFLVWDDDGRYIAANRAACEILGTTLPELLGQRVGGHSDDRAEGLIDEALRRGFLHGTASVKRFDGSGEITVFYVTFTTKTAGLPYMGTIIFRLSDDDE